MTKGRVLAKEVACVITLAGYAAKVIEGLFESVKVVRGVFRVDGCEVRDYGVEFVLADEFV